MTDVQGHRGARALFPENTLEGFRSTIALGIRRIEIDVGVTRDGAVVVHHDPALNGDVARDGAGAWVGQGLVLHALTRAQLAEYDVGRLRPGSALAARFSRQTPQDGARIPELGAVLLLDDRTAWTIELKTMPDHPDWTVPPEEMMERVLHVAGAVGALDRITVQSFDWRAPRHARRIRPAVARAWLTAAATVADAPLWLGRHVQTMADVPAAIAAEGGGAWSPEHPDLTAGLLQAAHALELPVVPWTVNEPADMERLARWGVDGFITDCPDVALGSMASFSSKRALG